ncbi:hypothetical protein GGR54DRAFT_505314 [Hypoxylon sp. NC1633]|nr:hypothetical protein GGR54DRAFT_505314 [Hypoxylon sp. NC1633]
MSNLPSKEQVAYMLAHEDDSLVSKIVTSCSVCGAASTVFIVLRLYTQNLVFRTLRLTRSDSLLILAWILYVTFLSLFASTTQHGGGRHIIFATNPRLLQIFNMADENAYFCSMASIKLSILTLYGSIFTSRRFHACLWAVAVVMVAWAVSCGFTSIFQCTPIPYNWDRSIEGGSCINYGVCVLVAGIINIITDFIILGMTIPMILPLHIPKQKKWLLVFTFAMGGSACIVSIVRLLYSLDVGSTADGSWDDIPAGLLSVVELMAGILAASIPTYLPLYRRFVRFVRGSKIQTRVPEMSPGRSDHREAKRYTNKDDYIFGTYSAHSIDVSAGGHSKNDTLTGISVTNQIEIVRYTKDGDNWVKVPDEAHCLEAS